MQPLRKIFRKRLPYRQYNIVFVLIGINVGIFVLTSLLGRFGQSPVNLLGMTPFWVMNGMLWQFLTYMFIHYNIFHLFFNMLGLYFFGMQVERELGSWEFLFFYLLTGILAGIFSFFAYSLMGKIGINLIGASGAVFSVLLAFAVFYPRARIFVFGVIPLTASTLVLVYTGIEILSQLRGGSNVAHLTHLAGFGWGLLYFPIRLGINPIKRLFDRY